MESVFYQSEHGMGDDYFVIETHEDFSFPLHLHRCFEVILMLDGEMTVRVEEGRYRLVAGDLLIVRPYAVHELQTPDHGRHILCIFSPELIGQAAECFRRGRFTSPVAHPDTDAYRKMFLSINATDSKYKVKGFLYYLCDLFARQLTDKTEEPGRDLLLLTRILTFIEEHYADDCSLEVLAGQLNYSYTYLSRFFARQVGIPYIAYVTRRRIDRAVYLLQNTDRDVTDIAYACGYPSVRSFDRNFKRVTNSTPTAARRGEYVR